MDAIASWHAAGLRWIGSLFTVAADCLEQSSHASAELDLTRPPRPAEDLLDDVRFRIQNRAHVPYF